MSPIISQARQQVSKYQVGIPTLEDSLRKATNEAVVSESLRIVRALHPLFFALEEGCYSTFAFEGQTVTLIHWGWQEYEVLCNGYYYSPAAFAEALADYTVGRHLHAALQ